MSKKYWQNFGEFSNSEAFQKNAKDEFKEELPFENDGIANSTTPRRDFLKYVGFSTAAAAIAAGCEVPLKKVIPYVNKPQDLIPGVANYYATTYVSGTDVISVVAKVRDGRPIKIEGNDLSTVTKGGTSARVQASVLDLYDTARLRYPLADGKEVSSLEAFDKMVGEAISGTAVVLLTPTITSPTTKKMIAEFIAKYPGSRHIQYDGISYSGLLEANDASYGKKLIPSYHFEKAKVLVSLSADFLGTWLNPVEFQRGYASLRKINEKNPEMSKHYQFESMMSMTGANADERFTHKPSEAGAIAIGLLNALSGQGVTAVSDNVKKGIEKAAKDLLANKGAALVVSSSTNKNVQIIVNAINEAIGANGTTINWSAPLLTKQGIDSDMAALVADMDAGKISSLLIYDANPAYDYFDSAKFSAAIKKVKTTVSFNERMDETSLLCKYVLPANHYLESWGDAELKPGYFSMMQPTINPLFKTRQLQDTLLKWSGSTGTYHDYFKNYWVAALGSEEGYENALMNGVSEPAEPAAAAGAVFSNAAVSGATSAISSMKKAGKYELVLYQKTILGDGRHANNPWLLEAPDPITRATWDNYVILSPALGKELLDVDISDRKQSDTFEVHPEKPVMKIRVGNNEPVLLPALIIPGIETNTIAIAVGYGRNAASGRATVGAGKNVYHLALGGDWNVTDVTIEVTGDKYKVAQGQTHSSYEGRVEVVKEMKLEDFKKNPTEILEDRNKELTPFGGLEGFDKQGTIYPYYDKPGIKW